MKFLGRLFSLLIALSFLGTTATFAQLETLTIALKPDKDPEAMLAERSKLTEFLTEALGVEVSVVVPLSSAVILEGMRNGTIDVSYLSSMDMVNGLREESVKYLLVGEINGKPSYDSYWLTLKDQEYQSIDELKGKPVAFASRTSTSGYLVPHWDLIKRGLVEPLGDPESFFGAGNVFYGTGYVSAVERLLSGDAEAAACSDYVLLKDKHLQPEQKEKLRVLQAQGPVPTHIIAVRASLDDESVAKLREVFLSMNEEAHQDLRDRLFTSTLVLANEDNHVATLQEALELTGHKRP
ncbi:MAG: phosphate/phosphite/phosphonate ABC transporter substrate-binding protein [Verrucomicrobiales bacterium]